MPNPTNGDVHVNRMLTNVSLGYFQDAPGVADLVFPPVPVGNQSDLYPTYDRTYWNRTEARRRAPGTESVGSGWKYGQDSYYAHITAIHHDIDDPTRANSDQWANQDVSATRWVSRQLKLKREEEWAARYFATGVWGTNITGVAGAPGANQVLQWSDDLSDPIGTLALYADSVEELTGYRPNRLILGPRIATRLRQHPDFIERVKYTQRGVITLDLLAGLLDVDRVLVARATHNTAPEGAAEANSFIYGDGALLVYASDAPSLMEPSGGYIFTWNGLLGANAFGGRIKTFRMEALESDRVEGEMAYDMKVVAPDVGVFFTDLLA